MITVKRELLEDCKQKILHPDKSIFCGLSALDLVERINAALSEPQGEAPEAAEALQAERERAEKAEAALIEQQRINEQLAKRIALGEPNSDFMLRLVTSERKRQDAETALTRVREEKESAERWIRAAANAPSQSLGWATILKAFNALSADKGADHE